MFIRTPGIPISEKLSNIVFMNKDISYKEFLDVDTSVQKKANRFKGYK